MVAKKILAIILSAIMIISSSSAIVLAEEVTVDETPVSVAAWDGVTISSPEELKMFRDAVNAGDTYEGITVTLTADIDLENENWTPIGNDTNVFLGYFDGNNKTISNLTVDQTGDYAGLFGYIKGSGMTESATPTVKDLTLTNVSVKGGYNVGAVAGKSYTCRISNVHVTGNVEGVRYVGGISGHVYTYIDNSSFTGNVSGTFDAIGGIAGAGDGRIYDCQVIGDVTGSNWVGGVIANGQEGTSVVNCYVKGNVKTSNNFYWGIGGIAGVAGHGYANSYIENNYFDGEVYIGDEKVNTAIIGFFNADNTASIQSTVGGNSWNTEYYPADMKVVVTADVTNDMSASEYATSGITQDRNNNLVMLESDLEYIDATSMDDVIIMSYSTVTEDEVADAVENNAEIARNTVIISTAEELQTFAASVNSGDTYEGKTVKLANDIDMNYSAVVIGTKANPFKGTFDGQNHIVSNLIIYENGSNSDYFKDTDDCLGLFGYINTPAVVKNVTVHDPYIVGGAYVAAIVGCAYTGAIDNCHVTGEIDIEGNYMVGGITGHGYAKISNCSVIGAEGWDYNVIAATYKEADREGDNVGGIVGHNAETNSITNCSVKNVLVSGTRKVGGIVGITAQNGDVINCSVDNVIVETTATAQYAADNAKTMSIGGIIGQYQAAGNNDGQVTGCTVSGLTFSNTNDVPVSAGAISGGLRGSSTSTVQPADTIAASNNVIENVTGATVTFLEPAVAKIGDKIYASLAEAVNAAQTGETIELIANCTIASDETVEPKEVSLTAADGVVLTNNGELKFTDTVLTDVTIDGTGTTRFYNTVNFYGDNSVTTAINGTPFHLVVNKDATLLISRFTLGYNRDITVYGNIEDAHEFNPAGKTPSLKFNSGSGVSVGGDGTNKLTVVDAYVEFDNSSWKDCEANHEWSFKNSYVSATSFGNNNPPRSESASWTVTFDDSVLAAKNYIKTGQNVTYNFTNGTTATTGSLRNDGVIYIDETSSVTTTSQQNNKVGAIDEHGGNNGTVNVSGTLTIGSNAKTAFEMLGGTLNVNGGTVNLGVNTLTLDADSKLESAGNISGEIKADAGADVVITAGTYTQDVTEWCVDGFVCEQKADGSYGVVEYVWNGETINNLADLKAFRDSVNAGETYKGKTVYLNADIDLAGEDWTPISCPMSETWVGFQGVFDGQGHTISNLKINRPDAWGQGLFGYIETNATIKNVTVHNAEVTGEDTSGVIAGYAYKGTFSECHVTGDVKVTGNEHVGGIVGNGYYANFSNCSVVANEGSFVKATLRSFAAGIVGYHGEGNLKIENCTVKNLDITAYSIVGAITGIAQYGNTITGCTVENVSLTKTRVDGLASIGLACGTWTAKANGADYTTTITNNSFKNVSINGTAVAPLNMLYGSNYSGSAEQIKLEESDITYEKIDTTNFKVAVASVTDSEGNVSVYTTLVDAAAAAVDGDTITLLADITMTADAAYAINFSHKAVNIDGNGHKITQAADCDIDWALLYYQDSAPVTIKNLTFDGIRGGAAIWAINADINVENCVFQNGDHTQIQGFVRTTGSDATIKDSKFSNNRCNMIITFNYDLVASAASVDTLKVQDCEFKGNTCADTAAIYFVKGASSEISGNIFDNNTVDTTSHGAIAYYSEGQNGVVTNNVFSNNTVKAASARAGVLILEAGTNVSENVFVSNNVSSTASGDTFVGTVVNKADADSEGVTVSGNYWGGNKPDVANVKGAPTALENYYTTYVDGILGGLEEIATPVASVNGVEYATLEEAFKAATENCTIEILDDVTVDYYWDSRYTGAKFTVPVTINGNGHKLTFTAEVYDGGNQYSVFRFEKDATVKNLTIDMTNAISKFNGRFRAISSKAGDLTVDNCKFIGNGSANNTRAIIFGESGYDSVETDIVITNSEFIGWRRGISDNENGKDVATVKIEGNKFDDANVFVSAKTSVEFNKNEMKTAWANITSYSDESALSVIAKENTLCENDTSSSLTMNQITNFASKDVQEGFWFPVVNVAEVNGVGYETLAEAVAVAQDGDTITLISDVELSGTIGITENIILDGNNHKITPAEGFAADGHSAAISLASASDSYSEDNNYTLKNITFEGFIGLERVVRANFSNATIENCAFKNNSVSSGVITSAYAELEVKDCTFEDNTSGFAVINIGFDVSTSTELGANITGSTFVENNAAIAVMYLASSADVTGNYFSGNIHTGDNPNAAAILAGPYAGNTNYTISITENAFVNAMSKDETALPAVFAEDWSDDHDSSTAFDLSSNYWDAIAPAENVSYKTSGSNPNVTLDDYYTTYVDGELGGLVKIATPVAKIGDVTYSTLADAVAAANSNDIVTVIADVADEEVKVDKSITITSDAETKPVLSNVSISGSTGVDLVVSNLKFTGNSWINSNGAAKLTVSGVDATTVAPSNTSDTNSRSAFIALGRSEQATLELIVENCNIVVSNGGNPILGWAAITKSEIVGNTFGSESAYQNNSDSVKFMSIADDAEFTITGNTVYSNYNGIVFGQNTTRGNAYTVVLDNNSFYGGADHVWVEVSGSNTCHATIKATSANTINGNAFKASDIKLHPSLNTFTGSMGVDVNTDENGKLTAGTLVKNPDAALIADGYVALKNLDGNYVVGAKPTATVNDLGALTVPAGGYTALSGGNSQEMPLSFVMQFLANQTEADMATSPYAEWYGDFVITFTGIENGSFNTAGCYLAGYYGDFGWVKVPVEGILTTIEEGVRYPVMLGIGKGQKYDYICSDVKDFRCAMFLTEDILAANPNLKVNLELSIVDNSKGENAAANALSGNDTTFYNKINSIEYDVEDFEIKEPVSTVTNAQGVVTNYTTLADAVAAANAGDTVTVLKDIEVSEHIVVAADQTVVLDLNGYTVSRAQTETATANSQLIINNGNLIVKDSSEEQTGKLLYTYTGEKAPYSVSTISNNLATLTVESGTIENATAIEYTSPNGVYAYAIDSLTNGNGGEATVTVNGGTIKSDYIAIRQFVNSTTDNNTLVVTDGEILGGSRAINVQGSSDTTKASNTAVLNISGGTIKAENENGYSVCTLTSSENVAIIGGTFVGNIYSGAEKGVISGGTFDKEPYAGYAAEGYEFVQNEDGTYGVIEKEKPVAVTGRTVRLQDLIKIKFLFNVKEGVEAAGVGGLLWTAEDYLADNDHTVESVKAKKYSGLTPDESGTYTVETDGVFAYYLDQVYYFIPYIKTSEGEYKYGDAHEYSVLTYAENAMKWDPSIYGAAQKLVIDMLNYGTYAREYFGYAENIPAPEVPFNSILTDEQKVINWSEDLKQSYSGAVETGGTFEPALYGINANIREAISLNAFYMNTEIDRAYCWTSEGDIGNVEKASEIPARINSQIYKQAVISGIYAYDIYDEYYVCAYDDELGMDKNAYGVSVAGYLTNTITKNESKTDNETVALVNLCKAMQIYGKNADTYFASGDKQ